MPMYLIYICVHVCKYTFSLFLSSYEYVNTPLEFLIKYQFKRKLITSYTLFPSCGELPWLSLSLSLSLSLLSLSLSLSLSFFYLSLSLIFGAKRTCGKANLFSPLFFSLCATTWLPCVSMRMATQAVPKLPLAPRLGYWCLCLMAAIVMPERDRGQAV